ncbi:hypothetical protein ABW19_dt0206278 [Dactylella cylindrospora]|nr:hypothetical protein ABW19_dt0206278 [Dactylella cylindrospora]
MASELTSGGTLASIRPQIDPSSPLSSAPASPPRKRSLTPTDTSDNLPDTETTNKMSNLGLDGTADDQAGPSNQHPKKRAKLTAAEKAEKEKEKEEKRKEKEEKEKEKAKIKAEKEEQKRLKDEEKAKKEAERAAEKARKDEEKAKKDAEKAVEKAKKDEEKKAKEEEKAKKERNQLRIANFFKPGGASAASSSGPSKPTAQTPPTKTDAPSVSATSNMVQDVEMTDSNEKVTTTEKSSKTDYNKYFQPFFIRPGVTVASMHSFEKDEPAAEFACKNIDRLVLKRPPESMDEMDLDETKFLAPRPLPKGYFEEAFSLPPAKRVKRGKLPKFSTKQILAGLNSSPVPDFSGSRKRDTTDYLSELKKLPRKVLKYAEDVRPAYRGTFTRIPTASGLKKGRNPFQKTLPGIDYDYDSEAEWVQELDDEGEDLMSEEEEEPVEVGSADEMDDFLDDEEEPARKLHAATGPLIPFSSGIVWEGEHPKSDEWEKLRLGVLVAGHAAPINPFSIEYWTKPKQVSQPGLKVQASIATALPGDQVRRQKSQINSNGGQPQQVGVAGNAIASFTTTSWRSLPVTAWLEKDERAKLEAMETSGIQVTGGDLIDPTFVYKVGMKPARQFSYLADMLKIPEQFTSSNIPNVIATVAGSDNTKIGMLEALKKEFSSIKKPVLKEFLDRFCRREGPGVHKLWICEISIDANGYFTYKPFVADTTSATLVPTSSVPPTAA